LYIIISIAVLICGVCGDEALIKLQQLTPILSTFGIKGSKVQYNELIKLIGFKVITQRAVKHPGDSVEMAGEGR
jgi:hypothetical protein